MGVVEKERVIAPARGAGVVATERATVPVGGAEDGEARATSVEKRDVVRAWNDNVKKAKVGAEVLGGDVEEVPPDGLRKNRAV